MPGFSYFAVFALRQYFSPLNNVSSDFNVHTHGPGGSFQSGMNPKMPVTVFILVCITMFQCFTKTFLPRKNEIIEENLNLLLIYSPSLSFFPSFTQCHVCSRAAEPATALFNFTPLPFHHFEFASLSFSLKKNHKERTKLKPLLPLPPSQIHLFTCTCGFSPV